MRLGTFLLELIIVLAIIGMVYYVYLNKTKSSLLNEKGEVITKDVKELVDATSKLSSDNKDEKLKKEVEEKVDKLMKKYNLN